MPPDLSMSQDKPHFIHTHAMRNEVLTLPPLYPFVVGL